MATSMVAVPEEDMPRSWMFDIHEDTPDEELGNMMEFSTQTLDISDDESKAREQEDRGKETVPPAEMAANIRPAPAPRKELMTDEPRTPLGDLDAKEYYAEGCDANSFLVVPEDQEDKPEKGRFAFNDMVKEEVRTPCPTDGTGSNQDAWKALLAEVDRKATPADTPVEATPLVDDAPEVSAGSPPSIDIWESESAKDESEAKEDYVVAMTEPLEESLVAAEARVEAIEQPL